MANPKLNVQIVSPEAVLYDSDAEMVVCRIAEGEAAFLPGHEPIMSVLQPGIVKIVDGDDVKEIKMDEGIVQVTGKAVKIIS
jgi:F-type H+-transporting ATPase subunit epsilon